MLDLRTKFAVVLCVCHAAVALPQAASSSATAPAGAVSTGVPSITLSTSIASPTEPLTNVLPSQEPLPPVQAWCPSQIFCAGSVRLSSTRPTRKSC